MSRRAGFRGGAVNGNAGTFRLAKPGSGGGEYLPSVSVLDSDSVVDVGTNVAAAGGTWGQVAYITARRVAANTEYRARLRFTPSHTLRAVVREGRRYDHGGRGRE